MFANHKLPNLRKMQETIEVTCGIRQGCSISTLLFKMVTFCIIEELEEQGTMYEIDRYKGNSLWLADDTTVIVNSIESLKTNMEIQKTSTKKFGLEINENKSKVMQVRGTEKPKEIGNFKVVDTIKYLGVNLGGKGRDIFREEKRGWLKKAQKLANKLMDQIKKSYDKVTVIKAI